MFWFVKTVTLIFSRTRKHNWIIICQCCLRIWRAGRGWGLEVLNVLSEGVRIFSTCFVCVCVGGGGGGGGQVQYLSFREKITDPLLLINDWSL